MIICITLDKTIEELVPCFPVSKGSTNVVATRVKIVLMRIVVTFGTHFFLLFHLPTTTLLKNLSKNSSTLETFYPTNQKCKGFDFYLFKALEKLKVNIHNTTTNTQSQKISKIIIWGQGKTKN